MCTATKTPKYEAPPKYAREKAPDNAALYAEAQQRAASRGGGKTRATLLTGLRGTQTTPTLGRPAMQRPTTVLG